MDYKAFIEEEKKYYSQDFSPIDTLMKRVRNALIHNVSV